MLIVTNAAAVQAAFDAKTPRPFREIMLEIYPDATEDCNGRFHAPHDCYICPITNNEFRAGEFLPGSEPDENYRIMGGAERKFPQAIDLQGNLHKWDGTRAQNVAAWGVLIEQTRAHTAATSEFIGNVGEKINLSVTIVYVHHFFGTFGDTFINIMQDNLGNVVIYKGAKILAKKGEKINLSAKVKSHSIRESVKQTIIERPKKI